MTDFDMILHDIIRTRGAKKVVEQILSADEYWHNMREANDEWDFAKVPQGMIDYSTARAAYKIAQRNKR